MAKPILKQMNKKTLLTGCFTSLILFTAAQENLLRITARQKDDRSVELYCEKDVPGNYTVVLNFPELTNASQPSKIYNIDGHGGIVTTLRPEDKSKNIGYRYSYRYIPGRLKPRVNSDFCYILPYPPGTPCKAVEAGFVNERYFGAEKPADWKNYFFYTSKEETVTAVRKGLVVEITDKYESSNKEDLEYTSRANAIILEQEDGTLVRYRGIQKGSVKVAVGDVVYPGDALATNAAVSKNRFGVSVFIYYLGSADFESIQGQTLSRPKSLYKIVTPKFSIDGNGCTLLESGKKYTAFSNADLITKEMSKKEQKKNKERLTQSGSTR
ncbi:MAG: hypothetical protein J7599_17200 [Niabella sp.]|nr:hypothetical protein [Niabella sp.]